MPLTDIKLIDFLTQMTDPRKTSLIAIYTDYEYMFKFAAGSSSNHQAWQGGYADHIAETLRINRATYKALNNLRPLPFTEDSAIIALFFHDIEKPFRYGNTPECKKWQKASNNDWEIWEEIKWRIIDDMKDRYDILLTPDEINALKYTHGEGYDHKKDERVSCELAAHVHHCDNTSARIYHDDGQGLG